MPESKLKALPVETLRVFQSDLIERANALKADVAIFDMAIGQRLGHLIGAAYDAKPEPFGSVTFTVDGHPIKCAKRKDVHWDQDFMVRTRMAMVAAEPSPVDPDAYMISETEYSVPEERWKTWPEHIRASFLPGRTVKPAKTTVTIGKREEESK